MTTRPVPPEAPADRETLVDQRDVLLSSLEDLEREHAAGDLTDADYARLHDRYTARAAEVLRALDQRPEAEATGHLPVAESGAPPTGADRRSRLQRTRRRLLGTPWAAAATGALVLVIVASVVLLLSGTSDRLPGQTATGSITLGTQQQVQRTLDQAQALESRGDAVGALALYHRVLAKDPNQVPALTESGWLEYEAGVEARNRTLLDRGQADETKAEAGDPGAFAPHLYLGSMLLVEGQPAGAVAEYRSFLADNPPTTVVAAAAPYVDRAFAGAGLPPPALPGS